MIDCLNRRTLGEGESLDSGGSLTESDMAQGEGDSSPDVDLTLQDIDVSQLDYDGQRLTVSGLVTAKVTNSGPDAVAAVFEVMFFQDVDRNQFFDASIDGILGVATVSGTLQADESLPVTAQLSGPVQFAGNVLWGFVDSAAVISERDETNNLTRNSSAVLPQPGQFNPVVEWNKATFSVLPTSVNVGSSPAVVDLNQDQIPDIVFSTFVGSDKFANSTLRAISGADGAELWTVTDRRYDLNGYGAITTADIDLDGLPEIIAIHESGRASRVRAQWRLQVDKHRQVQVPQDCCHFDCRSRWEWITGDHRRSNCA